jgi:hypothetical protein
MMDMLVTLAMMMPGLPLDAVEGQLVAFEALRRIAGPEQDGAASDLLREAAGACTDAACRDRLLRAAGDIAAGRPCADVPAEAAGQATGPEWVEAPPVAYEDTDDEEDEDEEDEEDHDDFFMDEAPPVLPHLPVRYFFPGLLVRAARNFQDAHGRTLCEGELLDVLDVEANKDGSFVVNLTVRTVLLKDAAMIENAANAWFQPVPSVESLGELCDAIDDVLMDAEEDERMDRYAEQMEELRCDLDDCIDWVGMAHGKPPECKSGPLASRVFGRNPKAVAWFRLLFAAVLVAKPD